jgi:hypothetical protein
MGALSKLFLKRGVTVVLESLDSSCVIAYSKTTFLLNAPLMISLGVGLAHLDVDMLARIAIIFLSASVLNEGAHLRTLRLPLHKALEWKNAHEEWISGGPAPFHPDVEKSLGFFNDYTNQHVSATMKSTGRGANE